MRHSSASRAESLLPGRLVADRLWSRGPRSLTRRSAGAASALKALDQLAREHLLGVR